MINRFNKLRSEDKFGLTMIISGLALALFVFLLLNYLDYAIVYVFSILCLLILIFSFKLKQHRLLLWSLFSIIFFHLIVFPVGYTLFLKNEPTSIRFNNEIFNNEKQISLNNIKDEFSPIKLKRDINTLNNVISDNEQILDSTLEFLSLTDNLLILKNHIIHCGSVFTDFQRGLESPDVRIHNREGRFLLSFIEASEESRSGKFVNNDLTIKEYFQNKKIKLNNELLNFKKATIRINYDNNIWTYHQVLAYSINIFSTSNMTPISRGANFWHWIHKIIVQLLIASLLIPPVLNIIKSKIK